MKMERTNLNLNKSNKSNKHDKSTNKNKHSKNKNNENDSSQNKKMNRTQIADEEITELENKIKEITPPSGYYYLNNEEEEEIRNSYQDPENEKWKTVRLNFKDMPLSKRTMKGLLESRFTKMTPIQRSSLIHSLAGRNILGASKTGSGKTLCFVIPVLELLYRNKWSSLDGLGALMILPTRELAMQVFEVFKMVGRYHDFSCGLVIGGNDVEHEKERLYKMNILIGTPGRLLQHITETPYFNCHNLQAFIIDEVDRILDEGFESSLNEILTYLPSTRQSLLFSATLTRSLKRLARVNLKTSEYINLNNTDMIIGSEIDKITNSNQIGLLSGVTGKTNTTKGEENNRENTENTQNAENKNNTSITPINLNQFCTVIQTHEKLDILYSFLKTHKNSKCLVFLNSCKQVRFYYEVFHKLKLGMLFFELHGKQKQNKRTTVFYSFLQKKNAVLFATDVASRGLDFTGVDWVIQVDCPEDTQTYVHRVGRTARYKSKGNSILFVNPKEEKFVENLKNKSISIKKIKINQSKLINLQPIIRSLLSDNTELLHLAQKAISSYIKSIYLQNEKDIFDISSIDIEQLSLSYGLVNLPQMKIVKNSQNDLKNMDRTQFIDDSDDEDEPKEKKSKLQKLKEKIKMKKLQKMEANLNENTNNLDKEEDEFLMEKRGREKVEETNNNNDEEIKYPKKKRKREKDVRKLSEENEADVDKNDYYEKIKKKLAKTKVDDKAKEKLRVFEKHRQDRLKRKAFDYEKHGLNNEEGDDVSNDEINQDYSEDYSDQENVTNKKDKPKSDNKKVNINLKESTLEEKEKVALQILNKSNNIFV